MAISFHDAETLKAAGFLDYEIESLAMATTPKGASQPPIDLSRPAWQATLKSRQTMVDARLREGWTEEEIEASIMAFYKRDPKRTPFDFLKAEYKGKKRVDYYNALKRRKKQQIERATGGYYKYR